MLKQYWAEILATLGITVHWAMSGLAGSFMGIGTDSGLSKKQYYTTLVAGLLSANYITGLVVFVVEIIFDFTIPIQASLGFAFLIGYGGLKFVETIFKLFNDKIKSKSKKIK